ncbi:hypothetical protein COOONC_28568 [Cooperia oncophora]
MSDSFRYFRKKSSRDLGDYLTDDDEDLELPTDEEPESAKKSVDEVGNKGGGDGRPNPLSGSMEDVVCSTPLTPVEPFAPGKRSLPFTSTPISTIPQRVSIGGLFIFTIFTVTSVQKPSLSESLATLAMDDGSPYGHGADRSRSFIGRTDPVEPLSPFSVRLSTDPNLKGKLRDRVLRKMVSKSRNDAVPRHVVPFSTLGHEQDDLRELVSNQSDEDVVEESVVAADPYPEDDEIVVLYDSNDLGKEPGTSRKSHSLGDAEPDVITIDSSSEEGEADGGAGDLIEETSPGYVRSYSPDEVKVIKTVSKFPLDTTGALENKLANLNTLSSRPLTLPDGGVKLPKEVVEVVEKTTDEQPHALYPLFHERRPLPPSINDALVDAPRPVHRSIHEKALVELHK